MSSPLFVLRQGQGASRPVGKAEASSRPAVSADQQPSAGAWKREMEQAQRDTWFKPAQAAPRADGRPEDAAGQTPLSSSRPYPAPPNDRVKTDITAESTRAITRPLPDRSSAMPAPPVITNFSSRPEASRLPATDIRLASLALALAGASRLRLAGLTPSADVGEMMALLLFAPVEPASHSEEAGRDPQPIRLHAEWKGQDVTVWLGIDARAETAEQQIAQLLPQIRACLHEQRSRLVKLVCNGRTVFELPSFPVATLPYFTQPKEFP